jgi:hypothetical protein
VVRGIRGFKVEVFALWLAGAGWKTVSALESSGSTGFGRVPLMSVVQDVFTYAFRGSGKYILVIGSIIKVLAIVMSFAPLIGLLANWILFAYFCALYFQIIETTATGSAEVPEFPEISHPIDDLLLPMLKVIGVVLAVFSPVVIYLFAAEEPAAGIVFSLVAAGAIYFPMAMMGVAVLGYLGAMGPQIVLPAIMRAGGLYWLAVFLLVMLYMGQTYLEDYLSAIPYLGAVLSALISMYLLMTNGRMLGIIYRERREQMGWI